MGAVNDSPGGAMDILVENHGSIVLLRPLTDAARLWVEDHIGPDNGYPPYWPTVLVEPRYVAPILKGMWADGLKVRQ
jgi:hypothetical protein